MIDLVLFGIGVCGQALSVYLTRTPRYRLLGFTVDEAFLPEDGRCLGLPVVPLGDVTRVFPPETCRMLVAMGYQDMNAARQAVCDRVRAMGDALASYVDPSATVFPSVVIGDNSIVLDHSGLQPGVRIGDGVCIAPGVQVGHHSQVASYYWLAPGCLVGGGSLIGERSFVGLGARIGHNVRLGRENFLGAAAVVTRSSDDGAVFVVPDTPRHRLTSRRFVKLARFV